MADQETPILYYRDDGELIAVGPDVDEVLPTLGEGSRPWAYSSTTDPIMLLGGEDGRRARVEFAQAMRRRFEETGFSRPPSSAMARVKFREAALDVFGKEGDEFDD